MFQIVRAIPTHIITGFLGSGKTSLIRHLLDHKPQNEYWAVLVNEFGDVGLDAALLNSQGPRTQVNIRELPGGCMCCTLGVPLQVTLNRLLKDKRPDRLLIEPTGLGHPAELIDLLLGEHYQRLLQLYPVLTLLDARKLSDARYTSHATFKQQIEVADIIVANKVDLYSRSDLGNAQRFLTEQFGEKQPLLISAEHGAVNFEVLHGLSKHQPLENKANALSFAPATTPVTEALDETDILDADAYVCKQHSAEGFTAIGWRLGSRFVFKRGALTLWLSGLECDRAKAVLPTDQGWLAFNKVDNYLEVQPSAAQADGRLELIGTALPSALTEQLLTLQV